MPEKRQREVTLKKFVDMQNSGNHRVPENSFNEPEPDYQDDDETDTGSPTLRTSVKEDRNGGTPPPGDDDGELIQPKKLTNPCVESSTRQALHRELLLNYKRGVNVLEKPELSKVLEQRKEQERIREWDSQLKSNKRTSLELKLEQRANKLKEEEEKSMQTIDEDSEAASQPEFLKLHAKIANKSSKSDEK